MQNETQIFPPKEVAMELRKVGFNEPCVGWYVGYHEDDNIKPIIEPEQGILNSNIENGIGSCTAPTYDQVIGWFAEAHGIHILNVTDNGTEYGWGILQKGQTLDSDYISSGNNVTTNRQQSLLTAFGEAIKLIEK